MTAITAFHQVFKNRRAALEWLQGQGFKVSIGTFYTACKRGLCVVNEDGTVHEAFALHYALNYLKRTGAPDGGQSPMQEEKTQLEIENLELKNKKARFEMERETGKYVLKKDSERRVLCFINYFDNMVTNMLRVRLPEWILLAHGDTRQAQNVVDHAIDNWLDEMDALSDLDVIGMPGLRLVAAGDVPEIVEHLKALLEREGSTASPDNQPDVSLSDTPAEHSL